MNNALRIALATLAATLSPLAFAHASLVDSFPAKGQTVTGSPTEIHLTFNEHVEARYCRIKLVSNAGKNFDADRPAADKTNPNAIVAAVPVLKPGTYSARWTAVGSDGHKTHGDFSFTVAR
jgi:methionine-rich copper-binding protein CopC